MKNEGGNADLDVNVDDSIVGMSGNQNRVEYVNESKRRRAGDHGSRGTGS